MSPPPKESSYKFTKDPTLITRLVLWGIALCFIFSSATLAVDIIQAVLFYHAPLSHATIAANETRMLIASCTILTLTLVTDILILRWIYVTNHNCHGFGASGMSYSPGWAVGYFFIPVLNLFLPIHIMRELRRVSADPGAWQHQRGGWLPAIWWMLWIAGGTIALIAKSELHAVHSLLALERGANTIVLSRWFITLAWGAAFFLVRDITQLQRKLSSGSSPRIVTHENGGQLTASEP